MLTETQIEDLIHLRLPTADAVATLRQLTPEAVTLELFGAFLAAISATAQPLPTLDKAVTDCCGTGGSGLPHYNTSTTVAFVLAAGGVPVIKFGNRAISSKSGSFDFLEHLGIPANFPLEALPELLEASGVVFLFAPQCYPALKPFNTLRRQVGVPTIFNFMGPLLNPVRPAYRLLGVSSAAMQPILARQLQAIPGLRQALVVHAPPSWDELTMTGKSHLLQVSPNTVDALDYAPAVPMTLPDTVLTIADNVAIFHRLMDGEDSDSVYYHQVCLNAGAGFFVTGKAASIEEGARHAQMLLAQGAAKAVYQQCRRAYAHYLG